MADRAFFQDLINTLAKTYAAPFFEPHVTIYAGLYAPQDNPETLLQRATAGIQRVRLRVNTLLYTDMFTKTLFVQFHPCAILETISEALRRAAAAPSAYSLNPHLSLIYKQISTEVKQHLVSSLHIPQSEVVFDEVSAMLSGGRTQTADDVENWNMIYRQKLS